MCPLFSSLPDVGFRRLHCEYEGFRHRKGGERREVGLRPSVRFSGGYVLQ